MTEKTSQPERTIEALCTRSDAISREKGWVGEGIVRPFDMDADLMHSELSEALEDYRNHRKLDEIYWEDAVKPCGIPIELADFVIRICQYCGSNNLGAVLDEKFGARTNVSIYPNFGRYAAEAHFSISSAFKAKCIEEEVEQIPPGLQHTHVEFLADALAETFTFCDANNINLWAAIDEKEAYNRTRPHRHGGKKA